MRPSGRVLTERNHDAKRGPGAAKRQLVRPQNRANVGTPANLPNNDRKENERLGTSKDVEERSNTAAAKTP